MSPSTTPLPEADKPYASREVTPYLEPEKGKQNVEFNNQSTGAPSTVEAETEKKGILAEDGGTATDEEAATIVATAIPKITDKFHSLDDISWYGSAFFMTLAGFQSMWGKAYKYFPLKISFLTSIFIFELGSLICGVAPNSTALIVGRAIAGLGAAGVTSGAYTIIFFIAEPKKRPTFTGIVGASYGLGAVIGPLIGGVFTDKVSWR
ncbi:MAG: hypothetical protein Q9187_001772, partial [Circinaria calcarea]